MKILNIDTERRRLGNIGEKEAIRYLKKNKYKILEKNYTEIGIEIDIIAENKDCIAFVEVKTRTIGHESLKEPRPASAVTKEKQRKIITLAKYYLGSYFKQRRVRFDIIEVYLNEEKKVEKLLHLESAFNYNTSRSM